MLCFGNLAAMRKTFLLALLCVQLLAHVAAHQCPLQCACVSIHVNCSFRSLTQVPRDGALSHVEYWNLAHNNLTALRHDSLQAGRYIKSNFILDLSYNQIHHVSEIAFSNLKNMNHLKLNNNNITDIGFKDITESKVKTLDLSSNPHLKLPEHGFPLPHLRTLVMQKCGLTHIPRRFFAHMKNIELLDMGKNNLTVLEPHTVSHLDKLVYLYLNENQFTTLPTGLFARLHLLVHINLAGNPLRCHCIARYTSTSQLLLRDGGSILCSVSDETNVTSVLSFSRFQEDHCPLDSDSSVSSLSLSSSEDTTSSNEGTTSPSEDITSSNEGTLSPIADEHSAISTFSTTNQSKGSSRLTSHVGWIAGVMAVVLTVVVIVYVAVRLKRSVRFRASNPQRFSILKENDDV